MRRLLPTVLLLNLGGCSLIMPSHDPDQAWVDLDQPEKHALQAASVDRQPMEDDRYFQVTPGSHELEVRFSFDVDGHDIGPQREAMTRTCLLKLDYPAFSAGQRYELKAGGIGFRPWARLYTEDNREVARARESRCGDV